MNPCKQCGLMTDSLFGAGVCIHCHTQPTEPAPIKGTEPTGIIPAADIEPTGTEPAEDPIDGAE